MRGGKEKEGKGRKKKEGRVWEGMGELEGKGRGGERGKRRGGSVEGPGKWFAPGPALVLGGPDHSIAR